MRVYAYMVFMSSEKEPEITNEKSHTKGSEKEKLYYAASYSGQRSRQQC